MSAEHDPVLSHKPRLLALAYRMLGSVAAAEDMVQDAYLRWYQQPRPEIERPAAWLTTVTTRLCLDQMKSARAQREDYPGTWLPEPLLDSDIALPSGLAACAAPSETLEQLESLSFAFMVLLETLSPAERAVYLLRETVGHSHAEIAAVLGRSEAACRQLHRRARQALQSGRRATAPPQRHGELLQAFVAACREGELEGLTALLAHDVVARSDGGGKATAASRPVRGARAVARLFLGIVKQAPTDLRMRICTVNAFPSLVLESGGRLLSLMQIHTDGQHIDAIHSVLNPDKLRRLQARLSGHQPANGETK